MHRACCSHLHSERGQKQTQNSRSACSSFSLGLVAEKSLCACRLTAVHLACIYIAAKNVEFVPYKRLLSTMLSHIYNGEPPQDAAPQLELEVLHALEWRLGPFFRPVHAA